MENQYWTEISRYGPKLHYITGIIIFITVTIVFISLFPIYNVLIVEEGSIFSDNHVINDVIFDSKYSIWAMLVVSFTILGVYIYIFHHVLGKGFGPNDGEIILYEEGFFYKLKSYKLVSPWKDVLKIELKKEIPNDTFNRLIGSLGNISYNPTKKTEPRVTVKLYTKIGNTEKINGFISGKYKLPQEIKTSDLSLSKMDVMNEHCANMLHCIARRAYNAKWTGELSDVNKLGWDIKT